MSNESKIYLGRKSEYARLLMSEYNAPGLRGSGMVHLFIDNANITVNRVTAAQLMDIATGAATVAAKMDPDNFDALWSNLKASIVEARTPRMTEADWDKAFARPVPAGMTEEEHLEQLLTHDAPEPYMRGLTPTMEEDRTADVCNAREDDYLNSKPA
jgi:hypothetical protein